MNQAGRPRVLLPVLGCALLVVIALALLAPGGGASRRPAGDHAPASSAPAAPPGPAAPQPVPAEETGSVQASAPATAAATEPPAPQSAPVAAGPAEVMPSGAAAAADGPAADPRIEADLQAMRPSDLSPADAAKVRELTVQVWTAETTGVGRERWPAYFPPTSAALRPYGEVRVQAVAAHSIEGGRVVAELLWAGADPAGAFQDRRPGALVLARTATGWEPVR